MQTNTLPTIVSCCLLNFTFFLNVSFWMIGNAERGLWRCSKKGHEECSVVLGLLVNLDSELRMTAVFVLSSLLWMAEDVWNEAYPVFSSALWKSRLKTVLVPLSSELSYALLICQQTLDSGFCFLRVDGFIRNRKPWCESQPQPTTYRNPKSLFSDAYWGNLAQHIELSKLFASETLTEVPA